MKLLLLLTALATARAEFLRIEVSMKDMNCASCSDSLGKAFERIRGVQRVEVRMETGTVRLELAEKNRVTIEQVWDTVKRIGFTPGATGVTVRGEVKDGWITISVIDKKVALEGVSPDGGDVELKGTIAPPPDPRTPLKLRLP